MEITSAEFVISNTDVKKCPAGIFPEYAFIGRSNVGRSGHDLFHSGKNDVNQPLPYQ